MGTPDLVPQDRRDDLVGVYKTIFDTWRSQVDSYWQRSNYFALFETAAIGACWHLLNGLEIFQIAAEICLSILGVVLTWVWYRSNEKTHAYVRHWWDGICTMEALLNLGPADLATQLERQQEEEHQKRGRISYRDLIQIVPILFGFAWIALLGIGLVRAACLTKCFHCR